jgi:hypothetical protein
MRAFVVRPFGTKEGINFSEVHRQLISPALAPCDIQGGTTEPFMQAGNIRADMFQQLLVADVSVMRWTAPRIEARSVPYDGLVQGCRSCPSG